MLKKIVVLGLVCLFLAVSFVVAEDDIGPYNPSADVNRDGKVDILDLVEVGQAYGSNYTLMHQTNKTTVTVLSYENNNFSYVDNALVAVFPNVSGSSEEGLLKYTNSSGTVEFQLNPSSDYVAIAWDDASTAHNYASFTTNSSGEASVIIWLNYYRESSPIRTIPIGWVVITIVNYTTGELLPFPYPIGFWEFTAFFGEYSWDPMSGFGVPGTSTGILAFNPGYPWGRKPLTNYGIEFEPPGPWGNCTYRTDEYGGAYVVAVIY